MAICRLKRVAADYKDDIKARLPKPAQQKNGKRVALVGGGPASLTVARDLAPLGYHCVVFDGDPKAGGMIRSQIPKFRLPDSVIDEECGYILDLGVEFRGGTRIDSMKALLAQGWDAIFVGSGAPRGRDLDIPGRKEAAKNIHIGIDWLSSVSFGHTTKIGKRVIVLGGGNTAMDCCRSSRRLGGEDVQVVVRSGFEEMKASPWEKEDAMHEGIPIHNYLVPKEFTHENGKLTGITFEKVKARIRRQGPPQAGARRRARAAFPLRRRAGGGRPGERLPLDRARRRHRVQRLGPAQARREDLPVDQPEGVLRRRRGVRPEEHHLGGGARPRGRHLDRQVAQRRGHRRSSGCRWSTLMSQKMGIHEWSYDNEIELDKRYKVPLRDKVVALKDIKAEVELGFDPELALQGSRALPELRRADGVLGAAVHRMRRLRRHLPDGLHHLHGERRGSRPAQASQRAVA